MKPTLCTLLIAINSSVSALPTLRWDSATQFASPADLLIVDSQLYAILPAVVSSFVPSQELTQPHMASPGDMVDSPSVGGRWL
jgi:hypothetical protein